MITNDRHRYLQFIYTIHIIFAVILLFIGIQYFRGVKINSFWYTALLLLGFGALGYHGFWLLDSYYNKHSD